jgi:hypothetical protein
MITWPKWNMDSIFCISRKETIIIIVKTNYTSEVWYGADYLQHDLSQTYNLAKCDCSLFTCQQVETKIRSTIFPISYNIVFMLWLPFISTECIFHSISIMCRGIDWFFTCEFDLSYISTHTWNIIMNDVMNGLGQYSGSVT